ncbi:MAG: glycosyltransferase [Thermodesulfobacteriota bacterium]
MEILFYLQDLCVGGVLRQLSQLVVNLDRRGHGISVVALYTSDADWEHLWSARSINIETLFSIKPYTAVPGPITLIKATSRLREIIKREKPEILYSFGGHAPRILSWLAAGTLPDIKLVWRYRGAGDKLLLRNNDLNYKAMLFIEEYISTTVPLAVYNSDASFSFGEGINHNFKKKLVIKNGFDTDKFKPDPDARNLIRREWGVAKDEKLIGIVGRVIPVKGYDVFIKAAASVLKMRKDVRFVCVGRGDKSYKRVLEDLSRELKLSTYLVWAGVRSDMTSVFNSMDILCSASYAGGFQDVIGEAMACGVPCVVTDVGDSAKIVGDTGIVVPHDKPEMLARGILTMIDRLPEIEPQDIRARIMENFTVVRMVDQTETALRDLLDGA